MNSTDPGRVRKILTSAATADVEDGRPAICGTVTLHCIDRGAPLRLVMPMLDAILLLNSLREIEASFDLQEWAIRLGCNLNLADWIADQVRQQQEAQNEEEDSAPSGPTLLH